MALAVEILLGHDLGLDRSYYRSSENDLANEWMKYERYLRLDFQPSLDSKTIEAVKLIALESVWNTLNSGQPAEDLYQYWTRFRSDHYPNNEEKIRILGEAIQSYLNSARGETNKELFRTFKEVTSRKKVT